MNHPLKPITLTTTDHANLSLRLNLARAAAPLEHAKWRRLEQELKRSAVLRVELLPATVVRVGSTFTVLDLETADRDTFTLAWPENADLERGRLSVFTPLGTAVLGFAENDEVIWEMPGGVRHFRLVSVRPPEAPQWGAESGSGVTRVSA